MCARRTNCYKKDVTNSMQFGQVHKLSRNRERKREVHLKLCTLGGSERALILVDSIPHAVRRTHSYTPASNHFFVADGVVDGDRVGGISSWCYEELGSSIVNNVLRVREVWTS